LYSTIAFTLFSLGVSLQIKGNIGQAMFNAFSMLLADLSQIEIGTMINLFNIVFFVIYIYLKPSRLDLKDLMQFAAILANGYLINLFTYSLLSNIELQTYSMRVLIFMLGMIIAPLGLGAILAMGIVSFPLESLCMVLSQKRKWSLTKVRLGFDIFFLVSTLLLTLITKETLYIREGTLISILLLSKLMGLSYDFHKRLKFFSA